MTTSHVLTPADRIANRMHLAALRKAVARLHATADKLCHHPTVRASEYRDAAKLLEWECGAILEAMDGDA